MGTSRLGAVKPGRLAGADQVVLNLVTKDRSAPYLPELRILASLNKIFN